MKYLISFVLLFPSLVLAVDDTIVQAIDSKASSAHSKADGNNSRIQALETEDIILHNQKLLPLKRQDHRFLFQSLLYRLGLALFITSIEIKN